MKIQEGHPPSIEKQEDFRGDNEPVKAYMDAQIVTTESNLGNTKNINQASDDDDDNTCNFDDDEIGKLNTMKKADQPTSTTLQSITNPDIDNQS